MKAVLEASKEDVMTLNNPDEKKGERNALFILY